MAIIYNQSNSNRCHTLDRDDFYAQAECGSLTIKQLSSIIDSYNKFNNWALVQAPGPTNCFNKVNPISFTNI